MTTDPLTRRTASAISRYGAWWAAGVLAVLAYVPALASSPGRMPADTKLYLYLDPDRLIADAPWTFDGRQFAGWVPHQIIAYLWPQGPWYSLGNAAGLPDWIVHRLWIGSLFLAAGAGVLWFARRCGLGVLAAFAAAAVYQLAPYMLPYVSRTSAMLLPWAALGWIVGLTALAATRSRWRPAALCALVIATVGAVNATALLMIAPAPILWLLVAALERRIGWGRAAATAARIGVLSIGVSLWWIVAVVIQGRRGADVLAYSESLESVSYTSTSPEVWRGLGYWLTYVRDPYAATTTAARDYMVSGRLIAAGFTLLVVALLGLVLTRWRHRAFAISLVVTGVVLGVGVHHIDDPSPLMDVLSGDGESGLALALRSSTRAVPVLMLGLALGVGALVDALGPVRLGGRWSIRPLAAAGIALLAVANLPSLTGHRLVDPAIDRQEDVPPAWTEAAAALDAAPPGFRVLQVPGAEFGAFRWGYTVDPPLPGLTERPLVTRDLLPLGSAAAMDLLYALDDRFQAGVADPAAVVPVARLLGADRIWLTGDSAFDRFRTPRPELVHDLFADVPGVGRATAYGEAVTNVPVIPMVDEQSVSDGRIGQPVPPVELVPVDDPIGVIRVKDREVLVAGSGDGLVDAAAAGLIDGSELVRYTGSLGDAEMLRAVEDASLVVVTDANRQRAHHWRSSQDVVGFTEDDDVQAPDVLRRDVADERLPVFDGASGRAATVAVQEGPVRARASGYGEPFAYRPEDRAFHAVDGDPTTAWVVGDRADPIGEYLQLELDEPVDHLTLRQPGGAAAVRHIGDISVRADGGPSQQVALDERSLGAAGQRVELPADAEVVTITIESVVVPDPTLGPALAAVGFADVDAGLGPTIEVVRVPSDPVSALREEPATPLSYVFTRLRTRPTDRWRSDPEPAMVREFEVPSDRSFAPAVTVRLDQRATDAVLADLLGIHGRRGVVPADRRGHGRRLAGDGRRSVDGVDHTVRRRPPAPASTSRWPGRSTSSRSPSRPATTPRSPVCASRPARHPSTSPSRQLMRRGSARCALPRTIPTPRRRSRSLPSIPASRSTGDTPSLSSCRRRSASCRSAHRRSSPNSSTRGAGTTWWRSTASRSRSGSIAPVADAPRRRPDRRRSCARPPMSRSRPARTGWQPHRATGLQVDRVVLVRWCGRDGADRGADDRRDVDGVARAARSTVEGCPARLLAGPRRGLHHDGVVGHDRRARPRPAATRRRRLQRLVDPAE